MSLYWRGKKVWSAKAFFSQQKIENRIAKNASNRPLRPFFLSIGFKLLLLSFGLLPTFLTAISWSWRRFLGSLSSSGIERSQRTFWVIQKVWPELLKFHQVSDWYWPSIGRVSARYWPGIGQVSTGYWPGIGWVSARYRPGFGRVLAKYMKSGHFEKE